MAERESRGIRAKTAGRFPDSTWRAGTPSLYHEKCAPQTERVKSAPPKTYAQREYAKCDIVRNDEIWKNRCRNEGKMARKWYDWSSMIHFKIFKFFLRGQTYSCTFFRRMRKDIPCYFASQSKLPRFKPSSFIFPGWSADFLNYLMASCRFTLLSLEYLNINSL